VGSARKRKYDVYGVGNSLVDTLATVSDGYLADKGIAKGVMTLVDQPAAVDLKAVAADQVSRCSGGSAANTIAGLVAAGGRACFAGKVGDDKLGQFYRDDLAALKIKMTGAPASQHTGSCVSLITPDGERSMLTYLGAATQLESSDLDFDLIADSHFLYLEGYLWDSPTARDASVRALETAKRRGTKVAFSCSDPFLVTRYRDDLLRAVCDYVDLLFCNDEEARQMMETDDTAVAAKQLQRLVPQLCVTLGEQGALVATDQYQRETPALPARRVVDTTGAGDVYAAGVLRGLTLGLDLVSASLLGARYGAAIVERVGARLLPEMLSD
jgi:sugar/nucleoside kinase (ribokinase family)